ncbi:S8 family serine peptidase [Paenibacillus sp. NPDC056933]|uniref:S8 family serine peptidase n=1 Tax=Paenibacillus sp. NPDC056933 TaxID=3345968 RepID=UPI00364485AC
MNSKKFVKRISLCFLSCLLVLPATVSANGVQITPDHFPFIKSLPTSEVQVNLMDSESDLTESSLSINLNRMEYNTLAVPSKILEKLKERLQSKALYAQEKIEVSIMLKYDAVVTKEKFIERESEIFSGNITDLNGFGGYSFFAALTTDEIEQLVHLEEIASLSTPDDVVSVYGEPDEHQSEVYLNGATEMTGIKKGRSDYGVTGNRDGKASYSKNDSVIAVIDTGIDGGHIDLSGGKILGWKDFVNTSSTTAYDDLGHGTHVASIAAGTGAGDPGVETGVAPGAALVGIKVCSSNTNCSNQNILNAMDWIIANKDTYGIDIINMSLGSSGSANASFCNKVSSAANNGILTVVAAGNTSGGSDYGSLNHFAKCSDVLSVANVADPYEGGWYLNPSSNRGTGSEGPTLAAPGTSIRAAKANSTSEYITYSGTSMASPMIAGLAALMLQASNGSLNYDFKIEDYGMSGYDKVYGNGLILGHQTIKAASGSSTGSFDNYRNHIRAQTNIAASNINLYSIKVNSTDAFFANTLIINNENGADLDLYIWKPGVEPIQNNQLRLDLAIQSSTGNLPQETISFKPTAAGSYTIGVLAYDSATYALDWAGQISIP